MLYFGNFYGVITVVFYWFVNIELLNINKLVKFTLLVLNRQGNELLLREDRYQIYNNLCLHLW